MSKKWDISTFTKYKIMAEKMADPELTVEDIMASSGLQENQVNEIVSDIPNYIEKTVPDEEALVLFQGMGDIIASATRLTKRHLEHLETLDFVETKDIKQVTEISEIYHKRKLLAEGKSTDNVQHDFKLSGKSAKELEMMRQAMLNS